MKSDTKRIAVLAASLFVAIGLASAARAQQVGSDKATYAPFEPINAMWNGLRKGMNAWLVFGKPGEKGFGTYDQWLTLSNYNGDVSSGKHTFRGAAPGTYEIRLVAPPYGNETVLARRTINVAGGSAPPGGAERPEGKLTTSKPSYAALEAIEVRWEGIRLVNGFVGIGRPGGAAFEFARREPYTSLPSNHLGKPASGSHTFAGLLPGDYELRIVYGDYHNPQVLLRHRFTVKD